MVDTNRTRAELQAILADNTTADISPQDVRDFLISTFQLTTKGDLLGINAAGLQDRLAIGADGTALLADSTAPLGFTWGDVVKPTDTDWVELTDGSTTTLHAHSGFAAVATDVIWDTKGDLAVATGADTAQKLAAGANNTVLVADSAQTTGLKWTNSLTLEFVTLQTQNNSYSSPQNPFVRLNTSLTFSGTATSQAGIDLNPTLTFTVDTSPFNAWYGFLNRPTFTWTGNRTIPRIASIVDDITISNPSGSTTTVTELASYYAHPDIANAGTALTVTALNLYYGQLRTVPASTTVTLIRGFYYNEILSKTGTVTTQVALDIAYLSKATTNIGIRSAATIQMVDSAGVQTGAWLASDGSISLGTTATLTANPIFIDITPTLTINAASASMVAYSTSSTVNYSQNGGFTVIYSHSSVHKNTSGSNVTPPFVIAFNDAGTLQIDGQTKIVAAIASFRSAPVTSRITSGALTLTAQYQFYAVAPVIGANTTVTTRYGLKIENPTVSGTLTNQYGIDIDALSGAGTINIGIRNASPYQSTSWMRLGSNTVPNNVASGDLTLVRLNIGGTVFTSDVEMQVEGDGVISGYLRIAASSVAAPSNTGGGVLSAGRALIGADATFPNASVQLWVNQSSLGSEVFRLTSTATNDDPVEYVVQNRVTTTNGSNTTIHTFTIPTSMTTLFEVFILARRTGGSSGAAEDSAAYRLSGLYKNTAGTVASIGAGELITFGESQAGWNASLNTASNTMFVQVSGAANNNVTWHMTARVWEVNS